MNRARTVAPTIAVAALGLGIAADGLFRAGAFGINLTVFVLAVAAWVAQLSWRADRERPDRNWWPLLAAVGFATMWTVRDTEMLLAWDLLAILGLLGLPLVQSRGLTLRTAGAVETLLGPPRAALGALGGGLALVFKDVSWSDALGTGRMRAAGRIAAGVILAVPVVAVFAGLFASADPLFGNALRALLGWDIEWLAEHAAVIGIVTWLSMGYLRAAALPARGPSMITAALPTGGIAAPVTVNVVLGSVAFLFTLFVATQAGSLFRGEEFIRAETGLTYAEYARGGFFQLVAASGFALPLVYVAPFLLGPGIDERQRTSLRALQVAQLGLTALVAVSALWRMQLYMGAYGLTEDRLFGTAIIVWIGAMIGVFARTLLAGRPERAAHGAVVAAALVLGALNAINPGVTIARVNLGRAGERPLDTTHLAGLGADAVPVIAARLGALEPKARCEVATGIMKRWEKVEQDDWRSWNLARSRARQALPEVRAAAAGCPAEATPAGTTPAATPGPTPS